MGARERDPPGGAAPRCARCGEIIGVYEPLVHVADGVAQTTSRAADPEIVDARSGALYHLACSELGAVD